MPISDKKFTFKKTSVAKVSEKKLGNLMIKTLACYFEYRPISLASVLGKRDEYMFSLRARKREMELTPLNPP